MSQIDLESRNAHGPWVFLQSPGPALDWKPLGTWVHLLHPDLAGNWHNHGESVLPPSIECWGTWLVSASSLGTLCFPPLLWGGGGGLSVGSWLWNARRRGGCYFRSWLLSLRSLAVYTLFCLTIFRAMWCISVADIEHITLGCRDLLLVPKAPKITTHSSFQSEHSPESHMYHRGQHYYKNILYKRNVLAQLMVLKIQNNHYTKQIPSHVLLQTGTNQWQQHCEESALVELFIQWLEGLLQNKYSKELLYNNFGQDGNSSRALGIVFSWLPTAR